MNIADVLKWAAGSTRPLPQFDGMDEPRLLALLGVDETALLQQLLEHRLTQRFLWRYCVERPAWANAALLGRLSLAQGAAQGRLVRHIRAVAEIRAALPVRDAPLLTLKGATTFALGGDSRALRYSHDLDLCYDDLPLLWETLHSLGYQGKRHFTHEYGKLSRGEVTIDLHEYFPVFAYPAGLIAHDFTQPASNSVTLCGPQRLEESRINYEDLRRNAVNGRALQTEALTVVNATLATLLLCAHAFKNYVVGPHYLSNNRATKLAELGEIADLTRFYEFDALEFQKLVRQYDARDAVEFCRHLLDSYMIPHAIPSEPCVSATGRMAFPESLIWGGWVVLDTEDERLMPRDRATTLQRLRLNALPICSGATLSPVVPWTDTISLHTLTSRSLPGAPPRFKLRALRAGERLNVELCWDETERNASQRDAVAFWRRRVGRSDLARRGRRCSP